MKHRFHKILYENIIDSRATTKATSGFESLVRCILVRALEGNLHMYTISTVVNLNDNPYLYNNCVEKLFRINFAERQVNSKFNNYTVLHLVTVKQNRFFCVFTYHGVRYASSYAVSKIMFKDVHKRINKILYKKRSFRL